jgi:hypothetical protein
VHGGTLGPARYGHLTIGVSMLRRHESPATSVLNAAAVISCISSFLSSSDAAARLSSRCARVAVPGMGSVTGETASHPHPRDGSRR